MPLHERRGRWGYLPAKQAQLHLQCNASCIIKCRPLSSQMYCNVLLCIGKVHVVFLRCVLDLWQLPLDDWNCCCRRLSRFEECHDLLQPHLAHKSLFLIMAAIVVQ